MDVRGRATQGAVAEGWGEGVRSALSESLSVTERDLILDALRADNGNRQAVAKRLGISPRTLRYKLARLREAGIEIGDRRTADGGR